MSQGDAGREKMVNQLLSFGADVATQSAELAKLVAKRLACVTPPEPPEVAKEAKEGLPPASMDTIGAYEPVKEKTSGQYKEIWMDLDYEMGEETLKRAEAINKHVAEGTLPDPINSDLWCDGCPFCGQRQCMRK